MQTSTTTEPSQNQVAATESSQIQTVTTEPPHQLHSLMKDGVEICVGDKLRGQYGGDPKVQIVDITTKSVRMRWVGFEEGIAKCSVLKVTKDFEMDMDIFLRSGWH